MWPKGNGLKEVLSHLKENLETFSAEESDIIIDHILYDVASFSRTDRFIKTDYLFNESQLVRIKNIIGRLKQNEPIQYITGRAWFYDLEFFVDKWVLIPRPETEELVQWIVEDLGEVSNAKIVEIGTGSGCIAVSLAKKSKKFQISASEICENALNVARINAEKHSVNVEFFQDDVFLTQAFENQQFDVVVSNPPYVQEYEKEYIDANVLDYEPHLALFVPNENPLIFYKAIVEFAQKKLRKGGTIYMEINHLLANEMMELMQTNKFENIELRIDFRSNKRMIKAQKL
ncbi:MAG: peptide chain release factor N(5)-glutamine methyltransferase [Bacteroidales bacterium]